MVACCTTAAPGVCQNPQHSGSKSKLGLVHNFIKCFWFVFCFLFLHKNENKSSKQLNEQPDQTLFKPALLLKTRPRSSSFSSQKPCAFRFHHSGFVKVKFFKIHSFMCSTFSTLPCTLSSCQIFLEFSNKCGILNAVFSALLLPQR